MSTDRFRFRNFHSRKLLVVLCSFVIVVIIGLGCGAWIMSEEKQVTLSVNDNKTEILTYANTLEDLLNEQEIPLEDVTNSNVALDTDLSNGQLISIEVISDFKVLVDDSIVDVSMAASTVADVLQKANVVLGENDVVEPAIDQEVFGDTVIVVHRVTIKDEIRETELAYSVETKKDSTIVSGDEIILRPGVPGVQKDTYRVVYRDGEFYSEEKISSEITDPVSEIVAVGTGTSVLPTYGKDSENESTASYSSAPEGITSSKVMTLTATAYYEPKGSLTKSGTLSRMGAVAVDPNVIPLGTRLYVEGYGYCVAEDTGGLIKGNRIDLFLGSEAECKAWGVQDVLVYILD